MKDETNFNDSNIKKLRVIYQMARAPQVAPAHGDHVPAAHGLAHPERTTAPFQPFHVFKPFQPFQPPHPARATTPSATRPVPTRPTFLVSIILPDGPSMTVLSTAGAISPALAMPMTAAKATRT